MRGIIGSDNGSRGITAQQRTPFPHRPQLTDEFQRRADLSRPLLSVPLACLNLTIAQVRQYLLELLRLGGAFLGSLDQTGQVFLPSTRFVERVDGLGELLDLFVATVEFTLFHEGNEHRRADGNFGGIKGFLHTFHEHFRQDLYFRLNVVNLHIPPLSQRREDIPLLAQHFLDRAAPVMGKPVNAISEEALALLKAYDFPGNVRELENIIERGVALCQGDTLEAAHLPDDLRDLTIRAFRRRDGRVIPLEEQERDYILWVLEEAHGNQTLAASMLGIDRVSLWRKLKKYGEEGG